MKTNIKRTNKKQANQNINKQKTNKENQKQTHKNIWLKICFVLNINCLFFSFLTKGGMQIIRPHIRPLSARWVLEGAEPQLGIQPAPAAKNFSAK